MPSALSGRAKQAHAWLMDAAFPFWLERGLDRAHGGYHERIFRDGTPERLNKRLRVQARQAFACAFAGELGWTGPWREGLESTVDLMLNKGRRDDGLFIHQFSFESAPADARADLYDQAFVLFALSFAQKALKRPDLAQHAADLWSRLDFNWAHVNGGFAEGEVEPAGRRRQNPHMHLFEASMAYNQLIPGMDKRPRMHALGSLFANHFYDSSNHIVREYFGEDWSPAADERGQIWEPGHSFEWGWLLHQWTKRGGPDNRAVARVLYDKADRDGVDRARNVAIDSCWINGGAKSTEARLWPQTERFKAALALGDHNAAAAAFDGLWLYISDDGFWADRMMADGSLIAESGPASSFYHILVALSELFATAD